MMQPHHERRVWVRLAVVAALALVLELALAHLLAGRDVTGRLLASGAGATAGWLTLALGFVVVRLCVVVLLPGMIAARLGLALYDRARARLLARRDAASGGA